MFMLRRLALAELVEVGEELGEADGGGFSSVDLGFAFCSEGCDGKGHGDAVIGAGIDFCAVEFLVAGDFEAVFVFGEGGSHGLQVFGDEGDAVGLFDAELAGVADSDAVDGVRGDGGEDGEFIDDLGGEGSADVHAAWAVGGAVDLDGADEFAVVLFDVEDFDFAAEGGDDVEERGSGGIHADRVEDEVGVGEEKGGAEEEGGGGEVAGDGGVDSP
ncbi:MAG: hypothetical protein JWQ49_6297 [Edaphobacter sp.]|nr:hypothetical protein [Edaphobacter sp.]